MPEIISYHDNDQNVQRALDTANNLGVRKIANILTIMVVLLALPVTLFAVRQVNTIRQQASGSNLVIKASAMNTQKTPYVITLLGDNFSPLMKAKIYDGDTQWGSDVTVIFESAHKLTVQFPEVTPPSRCNIKTNCTIKLQLIDPSTNFLSNKTNIAVY